MKLKGLHLIWTLVILFVLLLSAGWGGIWVYASQQTIPKNVALTQGGSEAGQGLQTLKGGSIQAIGGLHISDVQRMLADRKAALEQLTLRVQGGPENAAQKSWTLAELGVSVNTNAAAAAVNTLTTGSIRDRVKARWQFPEQLSISVSWNKAVFLKQIRSQWGYLDAGEPKNAKRTIRANDEVVYTAHTDAYRLDADTMFSHAVQAVERLLGASWNEGLKPISLKVELQVIHPSVTLQRLKDEGVERRIAAFTTDFTTSGAGRAFNVEMTARTLNDWELAPGEVFDYNKVIALTNKNYGYRAAPVILNGEFVPGIGGGICQVSSTLYNAALHAGLEMVERRNHSLPVAYLPMGQDATYAEGAINFRFKNTTGKTLIIRTEVKDRELTVKLFGTMPRNVSYTISSKTVSTVAPPVKEVARASLQPGTRRLLTTGKSGYVVETFRTKLVNGKVVSSNRISRDTYKAQATVYAIAPEQSHPESINDNEKPLLEDGVAE
ncbi:VanW family protein [Paenibacillus sp. R14(2021)]|uniref:VanW family protein n=1 Tax=Paenibacillus sp. R14(2021) TaxID=2859228 RepID=UPI001C6113B3|nr:VanW family protein [Paenibacillus sp. R14(2021)]